MSASPINKSFFAYPALRSLCDLCDSAVKKFSLSSSFKNQKSSIINRQSNRSIKRIYLYQSLPLLFIFLTSCADKPTATPPPSKPKKEEVRLVGRIASVHKNHNYVLIQSYGPWNIQTGTILATNGPDGRAANLKVTGEKIGQFAAADIQSGTLESGDSVYTTLSVEAIDTPDEEIIEPEGQVPEI